MKSRTVRRIKHTITLSIICLLGCGGPSAYAKMSTAEDSNFVQILTAPTFYVKTDGQTYTGLADNMQSGMNSQVVARFYFIPGSNDRIKSYHLQLRMKWEAAGTVEKYAGSDVSKSYVLGNRPKKIDKQVIFPISMNDLEPFLVNACNTTANGFRGLGQTNKQIFSNEHNVNAQVYASHAIDVQLVPPNSFDNAGFVDPDTYVKIVCMKAPAPTVATPGGLQLGSGVTDASLTILSQSTLGGACKVNLSSEIKTNLPNTKVTFRYEHINGKQSDLKTVTTSESKTAVVAHWYDVPVDPDKAEAGSIRIVGVSHPFQSSWQSYNMSCNSPGPGGLALVTRPTVKLTVEPINNVMYKGMICPTQVRVLATLMSKQAFSGTGLITIKDESFAFSPHEVNLSPNIGSIYYEAFNLKPWASVNSPGGMAGGTQTFQNQPGSNSLPSQRFQIRYALNTGQENVVMTPYKTLSVSCKPAIMNPAVSVGAPATVTAPDAAAPQQARQLQPGAQRLHSPEQQRDMQRLRLQTPVNKASEIKPSGEKKQ